MKGFLFEYFRYTKGERNGFVVLMSLCIILLTYYHFNHLIFRQEERDLAHYEELLKKVYKEPLVASTVVESPIELKKFDPNSAPESLLLNLGLTKKQVKTLINFRSKGGKFFKAEDLLKIYGINQQDFDRLKDYIVFPAKKSKSVQDMKAPKRASYPLFDFDPNTASEEVLKKLGLQKKIINTIANFRKVVPFAEAADFAKVYGLKKQDFERLAPYIKIAKEDEEEEVQNKTIIKEHKSTQEYKQVWKPSMVNINTAGPEEWEDLRGIGPVFSKRIVKFRDKLGGFHSKNQVRETYGMTDSLYTAIEPYLAISSTGKKIDINNATLEELKAHPYFNWKQAKVLVNYRKHHGPFKDTTDLVKVKVISKEALEKIVPYLEFVVDESVNKQ